MKNKLLISIMAIGFLFLGTIPARAIEETKTPVRFIYINGSNNNTEKDKLTFIDGMKKIHVCMKKDFETNTFIKKNLLDNGNMYISDKPKIFFWGYNSQSSLSNVKDDLLTLNMISPKMAQTVRTIITNVMHDAIWVQKEYNMQMIVDNLHRDIMKSYQKGEKVVLFGHSAGSFITYRYLFHKLPAISTEEMAVFGDRDEGGANDGFYRKHPMKPTCVDALTASKVGVYSTTGEFIMNSSKEQRRENYLKLNEYTATQCVPENELLGIVNYGSPIALFYSDAGVTTVEINKYNLYLYKYLKDNNMFFLTVNFTDDPIGFPLSKNLTAEEIENIHNVGFNTTGKGFFYSKSDVRSPSSFVGAHNSYWKYPNKFAKAVVDAYTEGYKNFYSDL